MLKLIQACDRPGDFPLPPGRSGCEFIARLLELESFASQANFGPGGSCSAEAPSAACVPAIEPSPALPQLHPYRSLDTSRLRLFGEGKWDMSLWLEGPLWLPYVEPAILSHGFDPDPSLSPSFLGEDRGENLELAALWDAKGLLRLEKGRSDPGSWARVFNAFKDIKVSRARSATNCLPFSYLGCELTARGVGAGSLAEPRSVLTPTEVYTPTFASLFQGDHHGVEFALESHRQMLGFFGAIRPELCLLNKEPPPLGPDFQALVIHDFVCISTVPVGTSRGDCVAACLRGRAQHAYLTEGVEGSPSEGHFRRISLASLSLRSAALPVTSATLCARLAGAWVSVALYRRCLMVIFSEVFRTAQGATSGASSQQTALPQTRGLAQELVLASALVLSLLGKIFATDASLSLGAYCSAEVLASTPRSVWLSADPGYSRLDTRLDAEPPAPLLHRCSASWEALRFLPSECPLSWSSGRALH